jgi:hypothetical protein
MRNRWAERDRLEGMLKGLPVAKWIIQNVEVSDEQEPPPTFDFALGPSGPCPFAASSGWLMDA